MTLGGIPAFLFRALRFQDPAREALRNVTPSDWKVVLSNWQTARILVSFRRDYPADLPDWVCARLDNYLADTAIRFERIKTSYSLAAEALAKEEVDHVVLKGFTLFPGYADHPKFRPFGDIDLYCPPESIQRAHRTLAALGYVPNSRQEHLPKDHLPTMMPPQPWRRRENIFDPSMPIGFELHFCWWNESTMHFRPAGLERFWTRRTERCIDGFSFRALDPLDNLGYTALNVLRDLLHGLPSAEQVYGLARFLHTQAGAQDFWTAWPELHDPSLRRLEAISFRLASDWFGCKLPEQVQEEVDRLPVSLQAWFREVSKSGLRPRFGQTKDGLWLHFLLLQGFLDRARVLRKGLFFMGVPGVPEAPSHGDDVRNSLGTWKHLGSKAIRSYRQLAPYPAWFLSRTAIRLAKFPPFFLHGLRIWFRTINLGQALTVRGAAPAARAPGVRPGKAALPKYGESR